MLFFWIESAEMAEMRVAMRVAEGGHNIPREVIYRRYDSGLRNLFRLYLPCMDFWIIYDNSSIHRTIVAEGGSHVREKIHNQVIYDKILDYVRR